MKIIKIAQPIEDRTEYQESPLKDQFEAEQTFNTQNTQNTQKTQTENKSDEYISITEHINELKDIIFNFQQKIKILEEEREHAEKTNNWDYFKQKGII